MQANNKALLEICRKLLGCRFAKNQVVFAENGPGDSLFACVSGGLVISIAGGFVRTIGPGNVFGELSLERNVPRSATVTAAEDSLLVQLFATDYTKLVNSEAGGHVSL
jgi:CRP-like cAMP-binding protein